MGDVKFAVEAREETGKGAARRLRRRGFAPGIVYGGGREATPIAFDSTKLERLFEISHSGINTLIDLEGSSPASGRTVIAKQLQLEPLSGAILHADFYEVDLASKIHVSVPVQLMGNPAGILLGGVLDQQLREVELLCLPGVIPDELQADVAPLELGDSLHVSDLTVPKGIELVTDAGLTIATVLLPRVVRDTEEGAEGEEAAGEAGEAAGEAEKGEAQEGGES